MSYNYTTISLTLFFTSLRTQCWPGYVQLLPPFTPRLVVNFDFSFSPMEVDLLNLEFQNQAENISVVLPSAPIKVLDGSIKGFMNYDRTYKQTDKQRLQLYIQISIGDIWAKNKLCALLKKCVYSMKKQSMFDTIDLNRAGALWQTLRLSSASCDGLTFLNFDLSLANFIHHAPWIKPFGLSVNRTRGQRWLGFPACFESRA